MRTGFKETKNKREGVVIHIYSKNLARVLKEFAKKENVNITKFCTNVLDDYVKEHFDELDKEEILNKLLKEM